jgi:hypothetical protein
MRVVAPGDAKIQDLTPFPFPRISDSLSPSVGTVFQSC